MMTETLRALLVEDSEQDAKLLIHEIRRRRIDLRVRRVETEAAMRDALQKEHWDVILCDWSLPEFSALAALRVLEEAHVDIPFIIVSGTIGEEMAVEAMRAGADDYLLKDRLARLVPAITRAMSDARARRERHELEAQLFQAQKMDAIGRLAGGIAHDFNNILMVILSEADLLREGIARGQDVAEQLDGIRGAAERAAALTRQLLTVSRRQPRHPRLVSLDTIVDDLRKMLERIIGEDIQMSTSLSSTSTTIEADPEQVAQVVLNLAVNARDAMPTGGTLLVRTAAVVLDGAKAAGAGVPEGPYVELIVSDTGCGMDSATLSRIFEPFFTTKGVGKGTGLGLSTVFSIVRQSGGGIRVHSEPGKGATFTLYFPSVDAPPHVTKPPASLPGEGSGPSGMVLVVDDDTDVRRSVCRLLALHGFTYVDAPDARTALDIFRDQGVAIDLVITDLVMPVMDGATLAKRLRELRSDVRILFMSGFADVAMLPPDASSNGERLVSKPFSGAELAKAVRRALSAPAES